MQVAASTPIGPAAKRLADYGLQWIFVEITNHCNMHCRFCPSDSLRRPRQFMDYGMYRRVIDQLADLAPHHPISLHVLGEPLLHPELPAFLDYSKRRGLRVYLFTNGLLLPRKIGGIIQRDDIDALVISVQTPTASSFHLRGCNMEFADYMAGIGHALETIVKSQATRKIRVELHLANTVGLPFRDWDALPDHAAARRVFRDLGRGIIALHRRHTGEPCDDATLDRLIDADLARIPEKLLDTREWDYWGYEAAPNIFIRLKYFGNFGAPAAIIPPNVGVIEQQGPAKCPMALENLCILADGSITLCCEDTEGATVVGHMDRCSIEAALESERRKALLADITLCPSCQRCIGTMIMRQ